MRSVAAFRRLLAVLLAAAIPGTAQSHAGESESAEPQHILLRFRPSKQYSEERLVPITPPLLTRIDTPSGRGGRTQVLVSLTNLVRSCDAQARPVESDRDFAAVFGPGESYGEKGPSHTVLHLALFSDTVRVERFGFPCNPVFVSTSARKNNAYVQVNNRGTCEISRDGDGYRLAVDYEDEELTVKADVALTLCEAQSRPGSE